MNTIAGLPVRNTKTIFNAGSRMAVLVHGITGSGKTTLAASLDKLTKKHMGKPTLIIAGEASDSSGLETLAGMDVEFVALPACPAPGDPEAPGYQQRVAQARKYWTALRTLLTALLDDETYGGVVLDSVDQISKNIVQPYVLGTPPREKNDETMSNRTNGIPADSDYQKMGELLRGLLLQAMALTVGDQVNEKGQIVLRGAKLPKHVLLTCNQKTFVNRKTGDIEKVTVDLPGSARDSITQMVKTVVALDATAVVEKGADGKSTRRPIRVLRSTNTGSTIAKDRTGMFPPVAPADLCRLYEENWLPKIESASASASADTSADTSAGTSAGTSADTSAGTSEKEQENGKS